MPFNSTWLLDKEMLENLGKVFYIYIYIYKGGIAKPKAVMEKDRKVLATLQSRK